jgi:hypothetical protein
MTIHLSLCAPITLMDILKISNLPQDNDIRHTRQTEYMTDKSNKELFYFWWGSFALLVLFFREERSSFNHASSTLGSLSMLTCNLNRVSQLHGAFWYPASAGQIVAPYPPHTCVNRTFLSEKRRGRQESLLYIPQYRPSKILPPKYEVTAHIQGLKLSLLQFEYECVFRKESTQLKPAISLVVRYGSKYHLGYI